MIGVSITSPTDYNVDIGILTIRDDEFRAVMDAFPDGKGVHKGRREYTIRKFNVGSGEHYTIAILRQTEQGNGEAQDATRDFIEDLQPKLLLVVGIAGGLPSDDYCLGDVVLSSRVNDYTLEARKISEISYSATGGPIDRAIASGVANLQGREELKNWTKGLPPKPGVQFNRKGNLSGPAWWQKELREKLESHFGKKTKPRSPLFISGPIASSDRLIKDPRVLFPWLKTSRHLLAVEMESAGVYRAARERCPMLAIRGISDIVGLKRSDSWTKYACASAAAFARAYLKTKPVSTSVKKVPKGKKPAEDKDPLENNHQVPDIIAELLYSNLLPLTGFPDKIYVGPSLAVTNKQAWAILLEGKPNGVPNSWVLHENNIYSFVNPEDTVLAKIVDVDNLEAHSTEEFAFSNQTSQQFIFIRLLKGALKDDLRRTGVHYHHDDDVYAFAGKPEEEPRTYRYQNAKVQSALTVVSHYESHGKENKVYPYLRHLCFSAKFRLIDNQWYLEISPTYRFTFDGKRKTFSHDKSLMGIKRLEGNRSVLSQVLLWSHLLTEDLNKFSPSANLSFEKVKVFTVEQTISDSELVSLESIVSSSDEDTEEEGWET